MKKPEILPRLPKCDREIKQANAGKMALMDFLHAELSKTFYLWGEKNTISTKHNKMRYACIFLLF